MRRRVRVRIGGEDFWGYIILSKPRLDDGDYYVTTYVPRDVAEKILRGEMVAIIVFVPRRIVENPKVRS